MRVFSVADGPGLAHDAGNLLGAMGLYCDLLDVPGVLRPEHLHYARELRLLSQRSQTMIRRLITGGHHLADGGAAPARSTADTVHALVPLLRSITQPDAAVNLDLQTDLPPLPFACDVLERILVNLTRNAATALRVRRADSGAAQPAMVRIAMRAVLNCDGITILRLIVADNGPGMPLAVIGAFRKPLPPVPGALRGFGHRIVRELLEATGGKLEITVAPGRGTTLTIDWPVESAAAESEVSC